jgi:hypothetical protein
MALLCLFSFPLLFLSFLFLSGVHVFALCEKSNTEVWKLKKFQGLFHRDRGRCGTRENFGVSLIEGMSGTWENSVISLKGGLGAVTRSPPTPKSDRKVRDLEFRVFSRRVRAVAGCDFVKR